MLAAATKMVKKGAKTGTSSYTAGAGKPPTAPKATTTATSADLPSDWGRSTFTAREKNKACKLGLLPSEEGAVIFPGSMHDPILPPVSRLCFLCIYTVAFLFLRMSSFAASSSTMGSSSGN